MGKRLIRCISIIGSVLLLGTTGGFAFAAEKELTPNEFIHLPTKDKLNYRTVVIRPAYDFSDLYNQETLPGFAEKIKTADLRTAREWYSIALFYLTYPKVKFELGAKMSGGDPKVVMAGLSAGTIVAPFDIATGGGPRAWKDLGAAADITDLVKNWDQTEYLLETFAPWKTCWMDGGVYGVPGDFSEVYGVTFRKDWFREAGIFNKKGEPRPEDNWTYEDMRKIAVKLTDPKRKRWGMGYTPVNYGGMDQWVYIMAASFGVIEPWGFLAPDKTGEYTWRFTVTPQLIETYQYLHDLKWKYECLLSDVASTHPWEPISKDFFGGRVGMARDSIGTNFPKALNPSPFNIEHAYEEDIGDILMPRGGKTGISPSLVCSSLYAFPASLSKEELKLAFEWWDWNVAGRGRTLKLMQSADEYSLLGKEAYPVGEVLNTYKTREIPSGLPEPAKVIPAEFLKVYEEGKAVPVKPQPQDFGLKISVWSMPVSELPYIRALNQKILTEENLDIARELQKVSDQVNREEDICYKIEGDKERFKEYYAAVESFFKENYPSFYQSEMFKETFEKYYNIW